MSKQATESRAKLHEKLNAGEIVATMDSFIRELDYHQRRTTTLLLAINGMRNELKRMAEGPFEVPPEIVAATEDVKATYARQAP